MITIPVWVFVLLIVFASITVLAILLFVGLIIASCFNKEPQEDEDCDYDLNYEMPKNIEQEEQK